MRRKRQKVDREKLARILEESRRYRAERAEGYREQALALFPHVCARCGREFAGRALRQLTVHHKDNNHFNNPPDGSNWELLCVSCHDKEHQNPEPRVPEGEARGSAEPESTLFHNPFEELDNNLGDGKGPDQA